MLAYIDLSIIVFLFNYGLSLTYSLIIFDKVKYKIYFIIITALLSIVFMVINIFLIPYFFIFAMILYSLIYGIINIKLIKILVSSVVIYYVNTGLLLLIGGCFLHEGILLISVPYVSFFILLQPIYITFIHLISSIIYKKVKSIHYVFKCKISINDKTFKGKGYYDSGNLLIHNDLPVIFIKDNPISNDGEIIKIKGINDYEFKYLAFKGIIKIKNISKDVYVVFVNKSLDFYGCDFLLNKYLL